MPGWKRPDRRLALREATRGPSTPGRESYRHAYAARRRASGRATPPNLPTTRCSAGTLRPSETQGVRPTSTTPRSPHARPQKGTPTREAARRRCTPPLHAAALRRTCPLDYTRRFIAAATLCSCSSSTCSTSLPRSVCSACCCCSRSLPLQHGHNPGATPALSPRSVASHCRLGRSLAKETCTFQAPRTACAAH